MKHNFGTCVAWTIMQEGGFIRNAQDPGCWTGGVCGKGTLGGTAYGVSAAQYPFLDISKLTQADAADILHNDYWAKVNGDQLPVGLDLVTWDFAVNAGPGTSALQLQGLIHVKQDGIIGPATLAAIATHPVPWLISTLTLAHQTYYRKDPLFPVDGNGWIGRSIRCQTAALAMDRAAA